MCAKHKGDQLKGQQKQVERCWTLYSLVCDLTNCLPNATVKLASHMSESQKFERSSSSIPNNSRVPDIFNNSSTEISYINQILKNEMLLFLIFAFWYLIQ